RAFAGTGSSWFLRISVVAVTRPSATHLIRPGRSTGPYSFPPATTLYWSISGGALPHTRLGRSWGPFAPLRSLAAARLRGVSGVSFPRGPYRLFLRDYG